VLTQIKKYSSVAIHVRFFNPFDLDAENNLAENYYNSAISHIQSQVSNCHFFLFSDNIENALKKIRIDKSMVTIISNNDSDTNAYQDLYLMSNCKHFIIANSTFSWWGAWLGSYDGKIVIAPKYEKSQGDGSWGFEGLIPNEWIRL